MNANELANLLEADSWYKLVTREEIATMLRQQQVRIDQLLETQDYLYKRHDEQQAETEALKAKMSLNSYDNVKMSLNSYDNVKNVAIQLTDEEIVKIHNEIYGWNGMADIKDFAKAILRKAQEK